MVPYPQMSFKFARSQNGSRLHHVPTPVNLDCESCGRFELHKQALGTVPAMLPRDKELEVVPSGRTNADKNTNLPDMMDNAPNRPP
jgi:hypothetical protein